MANKTTIPKVQESPSDIDKEQEEAKAAEILNSLVSKEVAEILTLKPTNRPMVQQLAGAQVNKHPVRLPQQRAKIVGPALPQPNKGLGSSQMGSLNLGHPVMKVPYQRNQQVNRYNSATARIKYMNSLRRKGMTLKAFSRGSQSTYTGYMPGMRGKQIQTSRYRVPYTVPHRLAQYPNKPNANYRNTWPRMRSPVFGGVNLQGGPGSIRPGKVIHMARRPQQRPAVQLSNGRIYGTQQNRYRNHVKNQMNQLPKTPANNFIMVDNPQLYEAIPQTSRPISSMNQITSQKARPISSGNQITSQKARPISSGNQIASQKARPISSGNQITSQKSKPIAKGDGVRSGSSVLSGSGSGESPVARHRVLKPINPKSAVYGLGGTSKHSTEQ
jgi:hypothetical protein